MCEYEKQCYVVIIHMLENYTEVKFIHKTDAREYFHTIERTFEIRNLYEKNLKISKFQNSEQMKVA
jgi:hypothetical protein